MSHNKVVGQSYYASFVVWPFSVRKIEADFLSEQHTVQTMLFPSDLIGK